MRPLALVLAALLSAACARVLPSPTPPVPEAGDGSPCGVIQAVDQARLIRLADGGTYNEPCP